MTHEEQMLRITLENFGARLPIYDPDIGTPEQYAKFISDLKADLAQRVSDAHDTYVKMLSRKPTQTPNSIP